MLQRYSLPWSALSVAMVVLAGCSSEVGGDPTLSVQNSSESKRSDSSAIPSPPRPLEFASYAEDPCGLVSEEIVQGLGYEPPGTLITEEEGLIVEYSGRGCIWKTGEDVANRLMVTVQTRSAELGGGGLGERYEWYKAGGYAYWEDTKIDGYPAALYDVSDMRSNGRCSIGVGIADDLLYAVAVESYVNSSGRECQVVKEAARDALQQLKGVN